MSNLELWDQVCTTNPEHTKPGKSGSRDITAICPQSQRKRATQMFGPYGAGWYVENERWQLVDLAPNEKQCVYQADLCYAYGDPGEAQTEGRIPIVSTTKVVTVTYSGNIRIADEWLKIAQTDALTKGLSQLGFNSDVFEGKFDDSRYVESLRTATKAAPAPQATTNTPKSETPQEAAPELTGVTKTAGETFGALVLQTALSKGVAEARKLWVDPEHKHLAKWVEENMHKEVVQKLSELAAQEVPTS